MRSKEYVSDGLLDRLQIACDLLALLCRERIGDPIRDYCVLTKSNCQDGCLPGDWAFKICLDLSCPASRHRRSLRLACQVKFVYAQRKGSK